MTFTIINLTCPTVLLPRHKVIQAPVKVVAIFQQHTETTGPIERDPLAEQVVHTAFHALKLIRGVPGDKLSF